MTVYQLLNKLDTTLIKRCIFEYTDLKEKETGENVLDGPYDIMEVLNSCHFTEIRISTVKAWNISPMLYDTPLLIKV